MSESRPSWGLRAIAVLVLLVAAWVLLKIIIGIVAFVAWIVVIAAAIVAVIWAVRTLSA